MTDPFPDYERIVAALEAHVASRDFPPQQQDSADALRLLREMREDFDIATRLAFQYGKTANGVTMAEINWVPAARKRLGLR